MSQIKFVIEKSPRIQRLIDHLYAKMPEIEADRAELITESYKATEGLPIIKRRSAAFKHIMENIPIVIRRRTARREHRLAGQLFHTIHDQTDKHTVMLGEIIPEVLSLSTNELIIFVELDFWLFCRLHNGAGQPVLSMSHFPVALIQSGV